MINWKKLITKLIYPILERTELPCYAVCFAFNNYAIEYIIVLDFLTTFAF